MTTRYIGSDRLKEGGFLATHKQDFNAHVDGGDYQHEASHIVMNPELSDNRMKGATVQETLEKMHDVINSSTILVTVGHADNKGDYNIDDFNDSLKETLETAFADSTLSNGGVVLI